MHTAGEWAAGYEQLRDDDAELLYQHAPVGYLTVAPDGVIAFHYMSLNPTRHVEKTLDALRGWRAAHP